MTRLAYLVHVYTATGAAWALLALIAIEAFDYRLALMWLVVATFVDATDGWLARWARVDRHATLFDGGRIDDIVDYATYVLVPGVMLLHADRLPDGWIGVTVVCGMLLASALGFTRRDAKVADAKTADHFFTGFPSYWNIVALYVLAADVPPGVTAVVVAGLSVMVFVPIRFVYPSRTKTLQPLTVVACALWAVQVLLMIWWMPHVPAWLLWTSTAFPAYYVALSLVLSARRPGD
jgi:phosphatidylcholine synthase